jgi:hypothetical protein
LTRALVVVKNMKEARAAIAGLMAHLTTDEESALSAMKD